MTQDEVDALARAWGPVLREHAARERAYHAEQLAKLEARVTLLEAEARARGTADDLLARLDARLAQVVQRLDGAGDRPPASSMQ
jgi:hypothetical protein